MSTIVDELPADSGFAGSRRQGPWLLPSNRKLRHLQGIAVRNLVVSAPLVNRARGITIDDQSVPYTLQSPAKALVGREGRTVQHSRSTTDLKQTRSPPSLKFTASENGSESKEEIYMRRRRSTLPWAGANPGVRQSRLEEIVRSKMTDSWFSLHCEGIPEPVYISELVENALNPSFKYFDLNICGPVVSRLDEATVKLWTRTSQMPDYSLLLELHVNFKSLQYIGKHLENFRQPFPPNCVIFHFTDGIYASLTDVPPNERLVPTQTQTGEPSRGEQQQTSSYDALMRLANFDDCIQDALVTREKLEAQINSILEENQAQLEVSSRNSEALERLSAVRRAVTGEKSRLRQSLGQKDSMVKSLKARRQAMAEGRLSQDNSLIYLSEAQEAKDSSQTLLKKAAEDSMGQIRRICEDLLSTYPIEPIPNTPLGFTIRGLALPNSCFDDIDREAVAGALGYTAHVVYLLSFYLSVPLPYPVRPYLSTSSIQDPISVGLAQRTFPLYPTNTQFRFEYGVFLLNKNIEYLMNRLGLRVLDIRQTLPNLKYLLYMLTAGTNELPARKVGGIRGLLVGRMTPNLSRQVSRDSLASIDTATVALRQKKIPLPANNYPPSQSHHPHPPSHPNAPPAISASKYNFISASAAKPSIGPMQKNLGTTAQNDQVAASMTVATPAITSNERNSDIFISQKDKAQRGHNSENLAHADQGGIQSSV
ncbi:UV radiation resistance protein [Arthroderma uncinatum]|uniref:UV radiation resistance protein n=1 Tax=Arthroderma uncinatum TaxID=74035 RepID=UPI00144A93F3|nr:UV radiation resistance protein [Arthroderma uncinatum]KAF3483379.1 UV radiation resistance protein [Arthroderma uncinatum]